MKCKLSFERDYEKGTKDDTDIVYTVANPSGDDLGEICFSTKWRTWIFSAGIGCFFDATCLKQVIDKLNELNKS